VSLGQRQEGFEYPIGYRSVRVYSSMSRAYATQLYECSVLLKGFFDSLGFQL
jgi:hypothetical protein